MGNAQLSQLQLLSPSFPNRSQPATTMMSTRSLVAALLLPAVVSAGELYSLAQPESQPDSLPFDFCRNTASPSALVYNGHNAVWP